MTGIPWLATGGAVRLERCARLPSTPGAVRASARNLWIRQAAAQVADELERWVDVGEIDGFNLTRLVVPETWEDFATLVVPELQNRGRYRTSYAGGTLRQQLFGAGDRLPQRHPAARWRR